MAGVSLLDSLTFITSNVSDWIARLDDLTQQIICRHSELTQLGSRRLKPKGGSTESLRPATNDAFGDGVLTSEPLQQSDPAAAQEQSSPQPRRKRKPESVASDMEPTKYRTRSMIIVHYDSAVQEAFEGIVRNVGTARNNIRKGRMAAKMKQMTSMPDGVSSLLGADGSLNPRLAFARVSRSRSAEDKTIYDTIDLGLEYCQSLCEHGAHQFLRDGDCSTEISGIKRKLGEVGVLAKAEMDKLAAAEAMSAVREAASAELAAVEENTKIEVAVEERALDAVNGSVFAGPGRIEIEPHC